MNDLLQHIRDKCRQRGWYGPDMLGPTIRNVQADDPQRSAFLYAPAKREQLTLTAQQLDFDLPPFLVRLYQEVANGSFGPGYGLRGALGGFLPNDTLVDMYQDKTYHATLVPLVSSNEFELPENQWITSLVPLCDWGCGVEMCVHAQTGKMFRAGPAQHPTSTLVSLVAPSLEAWLEQWVKTDVFV